MTKFSVFLLVLAALALASPALAHDELQSTTPTSGATVEAGSIPIRLVFTEAPMDLPFGQGNLIAVARLSDGEQLGPACARIEGKTLTTNLHLAVTGDYKVLWRVVAEDGHVVTGDFTFSVVNNTYYSTDNPGNQCFDDEGKELDISKQDLLSKRIEPADRFWSGVFLAFGIVSLGSLAGALMVKRRQRS